MVTDYDRQCIDDIVKKTGIANEIAEMYYIQNNKQLEGTLKSIYENYGKLDKMKEDYFAFSHIIFQNPILNEPLNMRIEYLKYLTTCFEKAKWDNEKYIKAQLQFYEKILLDDKVKEVNKQKINLEKYQYFLLIDICHILGFDKKKIKSKQMNDIIQNLMKDFSDLLLYKFRLLMSYLIDSGVDFEYWNYKYNFIKEKNYIQICKQNYQFSRKKPFTLLVTATMSAGKSTLINGIMGENISLAQNMATTDKIHKIIGKAFDDGYAYEYDHELVLMATKEELLEDNKENKSDTILVGAYYKGLLGGERVVIHDSPGVNFSGKDAHKQITNDLIKQRDNYDLLLYVMNASQLGTNDEKEHLDYVKSQIGNKQIVFVINKIDVFNPEEEDVEQIIEGQRQYLVKCGFHNPIILPISAKAAYLARTLNEENLPRSKRREFDNLIYLFEIMNLQNYYKKYFPQITIPDSTNDKEQLLKNSGFLYMETIIKNKLNNKRKNKRRTI